MVVANVVCVDNVFMSEQRMTIDSAHPRNNGDTMAQRLIVDSLTTERHQIRWLGRRCDINGSDVWTLRWHSGSNVVYNVRTLLLVCRKVAFMVIWLPATFWILMKFTTTKNVHTPLSSLSDVDVGQLGVEESPWWAVQGPAPWPHVPEGYVDGTRGTVVAGGGDCCCLECATS